MAYLQWQKRSYRDWEPAVYATDEIFTVINVSTTDLVGAAFVRVTEAFNGTNTDATIELGDSGTRSRFITTSNSDAQNTGVKQGTGAGLATSPGYLYTAADTIDINCITDTANNGTTGIVDVWVYVAHGVPYI